MSDLDTQAQFKRLHESAEEMFELLEEFDHATQGSYDANSPIARARALITKIKEGNVNNLDQDMQIVEPLSTLGLLSLLENYYLGNAHYSQRFVDAVKVVYEERIKS